MARACLIQILEPEGEREGESPTHGSIRAIRLAISAEAHALLSQWDDAERAYRRALEQVDDTTIKRSWYFNLASIALRATDNAQGKAALDTVLEISSSDDISRRALELRRALQPTSRPFLAGNRAN
jgi:hypothetical protein